MATAWVCATSYFTYAQSLGLSRRDFFLGTSLLGAVYVLGYGVALYLFSRLETATNAWGVNLNFFNLPFLVVDNPIGQLAVHIGVLAAFGGLGIFLGALYHRWRMIAMYAVGPDHHGGLGVAITGITVAGTWPSVGSWFVEESPLLLLGLIPLGLAVLATGGSYLVLRRAAP